MAGDYHINPRIRAYGKARIDVTRRAKDEQEWQSLWKAPAHAYPFSLGEGWKFCVEYRVEDYAAEIGFFIDVLGFPVYSFSLSFAQFTSPSQDFLFGVSEAPPGEQSTPPNSLRLQFKVKDLLALVQELEQRGIAFEQSPVPVQEGARMYIAIFRTPHGIPIDLWGEVEYVPAPSAPEDVASEPEKDRRQDQTDEVGQTFISDEEQLEAEENPEPEQDEGSDREEEDVPANREEQTGFWTQISRSVSGIKDKSSRSVLSGKPQTTKHTPGNGEITYAPIEDDNSEPDEPEEPDNEEYP